MVCARNVNTLYGMMMSNKDRPNGMPDKPHPYQKKDKKLEPDVTADFKEDVMLVRLGGQIEDIRKDIDLNYRRCHFKNPLVPEMLIMMEQQLKAMQELLGVPEEFYAKEESKGMSFGITLEDTQ